MVQQELKPIRILKLIRKGRKPCLFLRIAGVQMRDPVAAGIAADANVGRTDG